MINIGFFLRFLWIGPPGIYIGSCYVPLGRHLVYYLQNIPRCHRSVLNRRQHCTRPISPASQPLHFSPKNHAACFYWLLWQKRELIISASSRLTFRIAAWYFARVVLIMLATTPPRGLPWLCHKIDLSLRGTTNSDQPGILPPDPRGLVLYISLYSKYTVSQKNNTLDFWSYDRLNIHRFSKFFHWQIPKETLSDEGRTSE